MPQLAVADLSRGLEGWHLAQSDTSERPDKPTANPVRIFAAV
jgi:hypothetical protein